MMPEPEHILKATVGEENTDIYNLKTNRLGYHSQYARNMLQINKEAVFFSETALLSGVPATDWSWSPLFADFDLDGHQDLFISNGIPKRPNDLEKQRHGYLKIYLVQTVALMPIWIMMAI